MWADPLGVLTVVATINSGGGDEFCWWMSLNEVVGWCLIVLGGLAGGLPSCYINEQHESRSGRTRQTQE